MITVPIAKPPPEKTKLRLEQRPTVVRDKIALSPGDAPARPQIVLRTTETSKQGSRIEQRKTIEYNEVREIFVLISLMFLILVLPAVLMLTYILFNPEAFQDNIIPRNDFSTWQLGEPLTPVGVTVADQLPR